MTEAYALKRLRPWTLWSSGPFQLPNARSTMRRRCVVMDGLPLQRQILQSSRGNNLIHKEVGCVSPIRHYFVTKPVLPVDTKSQICFHKPLHCKAAFRRWAEQIQHSSRWTELRLRVSGIAAHLRFRHLRSASVFFTLGVSLSCRT